MFPSNIDADPDPTTQVTWPAGRRLHRDASSHHAAAESPQVERSRPPFNPTKSDEGMQQGKKRLSTRDLINLSISMGGAQIAWTVELGCVYTIFMRHHLFTRRQIRDTIPTLVRLIRTVNIFSLAGRSYQRSYCATSHW